MNVANFGLTEFYLPPRYGGAKLTMCSQLLNAPQFLILGNWDRNPVWTAPYLTLAGGQPTNYVVNGSGIGDHTKRFPYGLVVLPDHP